LVVYVSRLASLGKFTNYDRFFFTILSILALITYCFVERARDHQIRCDETKEVYGPNGWQTWWFLSAADLMCLAIPWRRTSAYLYLAWLFMLSPPCFVQADFGQRWDYEMFLRTIACVGFSASFVLLADMRLGLGMRR
jgi:hypothetical protein